MGGEGAIDKGDGKGLEFLAQRGVNRTEEFIPKSRNAR
jgi:hypothetical protein